MEEVIANEMSQAPHRKLQSKRHHPQSGPRTFPNHIKMPPCLHRNNVLDSVKGCGEDGRSNNVPGVFHERNGPQSARDGNSTIGE
jgi:hypothetical protein